jgi:glycosyltransferase 2 family protein
VFGGLVLAGAAIFLTKVFKPINMPNIFTVSFLRIVPAVLLADCVAIVWLGMVMVAILVFLLAVPISSGQGVLIVGAMALSWACGFVTPGAPGGLGVRESSLLLILSPFIRVELLMTAILLHRLVSILGDVVIWGVGQIVSWRPIQ